MPTTTLLLRAHDGPDVLLRLVATLHRRGWTVRTLRSTPSSDGTLEVAATLAGRLRPDHVAAVLRRLVGVLDVTCVTSAGVPEGVAVADARSRAPWSHRRTPQSAGSLV
jgi:acetolactate synthase regulatory subunit